MEATLKVVMDRASSSVATDIRCVRDERRSLASKSPVQRAAEVTLLESEASASVIALLAQRVGHSLRMQTLTFHFRKQAHIVRRKDASLSNTTHVEHDLTSVTEEHVVRVDATTDAMVGMIHTAGKLESTRNETVRELSRMRESASVEAAIARVRAAIQRL